MMSRNTLVRTGEEAFPCFEFTPEGIIVKFTEDNGTKHNYLISRLDEDYNHDYWYSTIKMLIFDKTKMKIVFMINITDDTELIPFLYCYMEDVDTVLINLTNTGIKL